ncbi:hypothetical protein R3P38DRAFT_2679174 [Favolaschia claudopus]|uniref:Uncharacterized protein n=1 Tax=Favolaschia claudopus TaxID=2862362 RepID=A0AAW0E6G3_9AGAR
MSSNSSATDDVLFRWGQSITRMTVSHGTGWCMYGIYLATFFSYVFRPRRARQFSANGRLQAAMLILFLSSTVQFVTDFVFSIAQIKGYLMSTRFPLPERKDSWQATHLAYFVLQRWPTAFNFIISDLIVLWRASTLCKNLKDKWQWWVRGVLYVLGLADIVVWCVAAALTSRDATQRSANRSTDEEINTSSIVISLSTTVIGTAVIWVVAWKHSRAMSQPSLFRWRGDVPRILLVLVETGFIWAAVQLVFAILQNINPGPSTPIDMAAGAISKVAIYLAAILPTLTLIIVRSKHSVEDSLQPSELSSGTPGVCPQCSHVITSGTRTRPRGESVRLTMIPTSPRDDMNKMRFGREPITPSMREEEVKVQVYNEAQVY